MFDLPGLDPVSMFESAKNAGLEREVAEVFVSAVVSATISGLWRNGSAKWAIWTGEGQAMKDAASAAYLTFSHNLSSKQKTKMDWLVLTVPKDLIEANNLADFETEFKEKP